MSIDRSILYNSDTANIFDDKGRLDRPTLLSFVDEVADAGADTFLLCQGGQTFYYPSNVGEYAGQGASAKVRETWDASMRNRVENIEHFILQGLDPFTLLSERIKARGMEALFSFRLNEGHTVPVDHPNIANFWREHPEWRLSDADPVPATNRYGADSVRTRLMDFAVPEVRERRLAEMREAMTHYPFDGLEIDFHRWPFYFKPEAIEANVGTMNAFVAATRTMLNEVGREKGVTFTLGVRVPPTLPRCRAIGLDPAEWHRQGLIDFLTPALFFKGKELDGQAVPLDIAGFREACPSIPIYGCIGIVEQDKYLSEAKFLWQAGADGIYLFNFFCTRQSGYGDPHQPAFPLLKEMRRLGKNP